jgi:hypothetical protein
MAKETKAQRETVERVMGEFKDGTLTRGRGGTVTDPKQAIAIALSEAGASNQQTPQRNRKRLAETKARERAGRTPAGKDGPSRAELYQDAARRGIPGRSRMTKAALARALQS